MCERLPGRLPADAPHGRVSVRVNHKCLLPSTLASFRPPVASLPVSPPRTEPGTGDGRRRDERAAHPSGLRGAAGESEGS